MDWCALFHHKCLGKGKQTSEGGQKDLVYMTSPPPPALPESFALCSRLCHVFLTSHSQSLPWHMGITIGGGGGEQVRQGF